MKPLSLALRTLIRTYPWRRIHPVPQSLLTEPTSDCRVALVTSAGLIVPGDAPFDFNVRGGDYSYRVVPDSSDVQCLEEHHRSSSFDHSGIEADRNLGLPLDRLHDLVASGEIGQAAPRHISLMGSITAPGRLLKRTAPRVADLLIGDQVDIALLIPV